jgi:hypothetical protein
MFWAEFENYRSTGICFRPYLFDANWVLKCKNWETVVQWYYDLQLQVAEMSSDKGKLKYIKLLIY